MAYKLWNDWEASVDYIWSTTQLLHCRIIDKASGRSVFVTFVYGDTSVIKRKSLWDSLRTLARTIDHGWLVLGDFNSYLNPKDKIGGAPPGNQTMSHFRTCLNSCDLLELPVVGDKFTWEREGVRERLDWAFCNFDWEISHPHFKCFHQLRFKSDHRVIMVTGENTPIKSGPHPFMYQAAWCLEEDFKDLVRCSWENRHWQEGQQVFRKRAMTWNEKKVGNIPKKKKEIIRRLEDIDRVRNTSTCNRLARLEQKLWRDYSKLNQQEEIIWFQKSRCQWIQFGDRNSSFFHATCVMKRKRNRIEALEDNCGNWVTDQEGMRSLALEFYRNLYTRDPSVRLVNTWPVNFPSLTAEQLNVIQRDLSTIEIKNAAFEIGAFKAPGPNG
ncbi:uncharacterized protein LOC114711579 [Neltuma alba]|uniref:uncharacterized protein LOC114711579 n=1 Tax=Neltuma alba TaxID=207710 RepID=UPI0010A569F9|nr:uncharacterized protein LOC114711579 [Prosopis alba]